MTNDSKGPHKGTLHILIIGMPKKMGKSGSSKKSTGKK